MKKKDENLGRHLKCRDGTGMPAGPGVELPGYLQDFQRWKVAGAGSI